MTMPGVEAMRGLRWSCGDPITWRRQRQGGLDEGCDIVGNMRRPSVAHPLRIASIDQQAHRLEGRHVARHTGLRGAQLVHQFAHAVLLSVPQKLQGGKPGGFGQGGKQGRGVDHSQLMRHYAYALKRNSYGDVIRPQAVSREPVRRKELSGTLKHDVAAKIAPRNVSRRDLGGKADFGSSLQLVHMDDIETAASARIAGVTRNTVHRRSRDANGRLMKMPRRLFKLA